MTKDIYNLQKKKKNSQINAILSSFLLITLENVLKIC